MTNEFYVSTEASGGGAGTKEDPWTLTEAFSSAISGNIIWIEAGTYTSGTKFNAPLQNSASGTRSSPIKFIGYTSDEGDASQPVVTLDGNDTASAIIDGNEKNWLYFENIFVTNGARNNNSVGFFLDGNSCTCYRCAASDLGLGGFDLDGDGSVIIGCEAWDCLHNASGNGTGAFQIGSIGICIGCYAHDITDGNGHGFRTDSTEAQSFLYCIANNIAGSGFYDLYGTEEHALAIVNCIAHECLIGVNNTPTVIDQSPNIIIANTIISDCAAATSTNATTAGVLHLLGVALINNTSGIDSDYALGVTNYKETTGDALFSDGNQYRDAANGDFRPTPTAEAWLNDIGFPSQYLVGGSLPSWVATNPVGGAGFRFRGGGGVFRQGG